MIKAQTISLYERNRLLTAVGLLHALLLLATLLLMAFDDRQVLGINAWVKPAKFMFSLMIYLWTIAWLSEYVRKPKWRIRTVSVIIAVVIIIETTCLLTQAARGTTSHFNNATDFDTAIFSTMGIMISIDMLMGFFLLCMYSNPRPRPESTYLWGIRAGLSVFLVGGAIGGMMILNGAHTFGAADGGPGMPLTNWSTVAGDMRIAHGLALHALQVLPIAGYVIGKTEHIPRTGGKLITFTLFAFFYSLIIFGTYAQARSGQPLIPMA